MSEAALWAALADPRDEHACFACAMLLKKRGHTRLPLQLVDPFASRHALELAHVRGLRALRDRRTQEPLIWYVENRTDDKDLDIIEVALDALVALGRISRPFDLSSYLRSPHRTVRLLAYAVTALRVS